MKLIERDANPLILEFSNDFNKITISNSETENPITVNTEKLEKVLAEIIQKNSKSPIIVDEEQNVSVDIDCDMFIFKFGTHSKSYDFISIVSLCANVLQVYLNGHRVYEEIKKRVDAKTLSPEALNDTKFIGEMCLKYTDIYKKTLKSFEENTYSLRNRIRLNDKLLFFYAHLCAGIMKIERFFGCNHLYNKYGEGKQIIIMAEVFKDNKYAIT